jgi:uncharacterized protein
VNAYSGKMSVYSIEKNDPILSAWEKVFPGVVQPISALDKTLQVHLRYPQDLFAVQSQMYGTYHVTSPATFYANQNQWTLSPISTGVHGSSSAQLPQQANGQAQRYMPIYEMMQLAGDSQPVFRSVEPLVRNSKGNIQPMTSILTADSSFSTYGNLNAYDTPQTATVLSPGLVNATINANQAVSKQLSLLDQGGSTVTLGTVQILPIADSLLYVRPLYVSSSQTNYPLLQDVLVLYGKQVEIEPTLTAALDDLFGGSPSGSSSTPTGPVTTGSISARVRSDISAANAEYQAAQTALSSGNLGTYQSDVNQAGQYLAAAQKLLTGTSSSTSSKKS